MYIYQVVYVYTPCICIPQFERIGALGLQGIVESESLLHVPVVWNRLINQERGQYLCPEANITYSTPTRVSSALGVSLGCGALLEAMAVFGVDVNNNSSSNNNNRTWPNTV